MPAGAIPRAKKRRHHPPSAGLAVAVGARIRALRLERDLSQSELGSPYFTRAMVSRVEQGEGTPSLRALVHFAKRLGVPTRELIPPDL